MKINVNNTEKISAAIEAAEKRARVRTISPHDISSMVYAIEEKLGHLLPKKEWKGLRFHLDPNAQAFPGAYRGRPKSTHVEVERGATAWFVTDVWRDDCNGPRGRIRPQNIDSKKESITRYVMDSENWS